MITQTVQVGDGGQTAELRMDAGKTLRALDERETALVKLQNCLKGKT